MNASGEMICACGTFAIGRCVECSKPVCGQHSSMTRGRRLCGEHAAAFRARQTQHERAASQAAQDRIEVAARRLEQASDPREMLAALEELGPRTSRGSLSGALRRLADLRTLLPSHDLVGIHAYRGYKKGFHQVERWEEISREPAWFVKDGSEREAFAVSAVAMAGFGSSDGPKSLGMKPCDAWLTDSGRIWIRGGGHSLLADVNQGPGLGDNPCYFVVPHGVEFQARERRKYNWGGLHWYQEDVDIVVGKRVEEGRGLHEALLALLRSAGTKS